MAERQRKRQLQPPPMGSSWSKRKREEEEGGVNKFQRLVKKAFVSCFPSLVIVALTGDIGSSGRSGAARSIQTRRGAGHDTVDRL
jgi:hypothetical protein